MISYEPFWNTLEKSELNWYKLVHNEKYNISPNLLTRLKHNQPISTKTLDRLCTYLNCDFSDIITHIPDSVINENEIEK